MVCYIGRKNYQACMPAMLEEGFSEVFLGAAATGYLLSYAIGQFLNGMLGDRISPKYMIFVGLTGASAANLLMGINRIAPLFVFFWCMNGVFNSMLWSPVIKAYATWLPENRRHGAAVWISATIPVGAMLSSIITSVTLKLSGNNWRLVFFICAGILFTMALIWISGITGIKNYIKWITQQNQSVYSEKPQEKTEDQPQKKYSLLSVIWGGGVLCVIFGIMFNGILKDAVDAWTSTYVYDFFGVSASDAALITAILPIVNLSGAFVANFINNKWIRNEITTAGILFGVSVVSIGLLLSVGHMNVILAVLLIAVTTSSMLGVNTMFLTFIPLSFASTGRSSSMTGLFNSCSYAAAATAVYLMGVMAAADISWTVIIWSWLAVAFAGMTVCFAGKGIYARNKHKFD